MRYVHVIFELDEEGEATGSVHTFCCQECQQQADQQEYLQTAASLEYAECPLICFPAQCLCEQCLKPLEWEKEA